MDRGFLSYLALKLHFSQRLIAVPPFLRIPRIHASASDKLQFIGARDRNRTGALLRYQGISGLIPGSGEPSKSKVSKESSILMALGRSRLRAFCPHRVQRPHMEHRLGSPTTITEPPLTIKQLLFSTSLHPPRRLVIATRKSLISLHIEKFKHGARLCKDQ